VELWRSATLLNYCYYYHRSVLCRTYRLRFLWFLL